MIFSGTFFLNKSGLFDFDLTFIAEGILFIILALVVTFVFISPITKQLDQRAEFIDYNLYKAFWFITRGYDRLSECINLLTLEISEMNRQLKLTRDFTNENFEEEILVVQHENARLLSKLKGDLSIKSAGIFLSVKNELLTFTNKFFSEKFYSAS
jgi:hypothetical protein